VQLRNFCNHAERNDEFRFGVVGVVGHNGVGKSNYLKGILRAFTGQAYNAGRKEEDLRWGTDKGQVRVDFELDGAAGHIKRELAKASAELVWGDRKIRTAAEVDKAVQDILGVSPRLLNEVVFVMQGQLEGILFQRPADRARSFQYLFGTDRAERLSQVLYEKTQELGTESQAEQLVSNKLQLELTRNELESLGAREKSLEPVLLNAAECERLTSLVKVCDSFRACRDARLKALTDRAEAQRALQREQSIALGLRETGQRMRVVAGDTRPAFEQARQRLSSYDSVRLMAQQRGALLGVVRTCEGVLARPGPSIYQETAPELEACRTTLGAVQNELRVATAVSSLQGQAVCPTCQQPVPESFVGQQQAKLPALKESQSGLTARIGQLESRRREYQDRVTRDRTEREEAAKRLREAQAGLAGVPEREVPSEAQAQEDRELIASFERVEAGLAQAERGLAVSEATMTQLEERLKLVEEALAKYAEQEAAAASEAEYAEAGRKLELARKAEVELAALHGRKQALAERGESLRAEVARLEAYEAGLAGKRHFKELCERGRTVLHRDQLPNIVARAYLASLNTRLGQYLDLFDVPFSCRLLPDLSVECTFDSRPVSAERLSGGQKVMLGIAFRFAVSDLFVNSLGLMILDEPTVYLDNDRINCVIKLLDKMRGYSHAAGLQVIVVTHEERLTEVFDQTIRL
jgi:DNA repair exonuclease SbcCD ATPase subunit